MKSGKIDLGIKKTVWERFAFWARNLRSQKLFQALAMYCSGDVLDVGGRDFFLTAESRKISFLSWTTLDNMSMSSAGIADARFHFIHGDGCAIPCADQSFDTVLNIQVLEHVFHPMTMVQEIARVLKVSGHAVFLIPQTSVLHELPAHYYNFTRFWIERVMTESGLAIVEYHALGGVWSSMASHLVYFFFECFRVRGMSDQRIIRNVWFYILFPLMIVYAVISIPICLVLSLGDLQEEPNNHLVVVQKSRK